MSTHKATLETKAKGGICMDEYVNKITVKEMRDILARYGDNDIIQLIINPTEEAEGMLKVNEDVIMYDDRDVLDGLWEN